MKKLKSSYNILENKQVDLGRFSADDILWLRTCTNYNSNINM